MKENIDDLLNFAEDILTILKTGNIEPILYGSLAYKYYIEKDNKKENNIKINDIDFYVHERDFKQLTEILKLNDIEFKHNKRYHTLSIENMSINNQILKLEFDSLEYWFPEEHSTSRMKLKELEIRILTKDSLTVIYELASKQSSDKTKLKAYKNKLEKLKKLNKNKTNKK